MKLFLTSSSISQSTQSAFWQLVGKQKADISVALIENGADTCAVEHCNWVTEARNAIKKSAGTVDVFDLRKYDNSELLKKDLARYDVVWVGGGNVFYLRWLAHTSGFDTLIHELCNAGTIYAGDSAGAIMAGPSIKVFSSVDDPAEAPQRIDDGLNLTRCSIVPHCDQSKRSAKRIEIQRKLAAHGCEIVCLNDGEACVIDGESIKKI